MPSLCSSRALTSPARLTMQPTLLAARMMDSKASKKALSPVPALPAMHQSRYMTVGTAEPTVKDTLEYSFTAS